MCVVPHKHMLSNSRLTVSTVRKNEEYQSNTFITDISQLNHKGPISHKG
jgi:hypothetical protein